MHKIGFVVNSEWPQGNVLSSIDGLPITGIRSAQIQLHARGVPSAQCELDVMCLRLEQVETEFYCLFDGVHFRLVDESKYNVVSKESGRDDTAFFPDDGLPSANVQL